LAVLSVENEKELIELIEKLKKSNLKFSVFREPDIGDQITAICIEPSEETRRIISSLPLMLKEYSSKNSINKNNYKNNLKQEVVL